MDISTDKVGLVDWLTHCDKLAKKMDNSKTRKKLVGRKFSYSRSRVGTTNTFVSKVYYKFNNSSDSYSKGLNPNAPVFTPRACIAKSVSSTCISSNSSTNISSISSRPPPVAPLSPHSKLNDSNLPLTYNVKIRNRFAALYKIDELEDIGSNSQFQKIKERQDGSGKKCAVKTKKTINEEMTASKPVGMMDTVSDKSPQNCSTPYQELFRTGKNVHRDQVC